jgi:hypothetical protein
MRKLVNIALLFMLPAFFTSCEKVKDIFDVEFKTTLEGWMMIEVDEPIQKSTNGFDFYEEVYVNPLDDEDIAEYEENIERIEVTEVIATVKDVNKEGVEFEKGTMIIVKGSEEVTWTLLEPWPIIVGDEIVLGDDVNVKIYKSVTKMLSDQETLTIIADGTCNQEGVFVTLVVGIDVKVTANPL